MRYFGHAVRRGGFDNIMIQGSTEGKRKQGKPVTAWTKDIIEWTRTGLAKASNLARDRGRWRDIVKTTAAQFV